MTSQFSDEFDSLFADSTIGVGVIGDVAGFGGVSEASFFEFPVDRAIAFEACGFNFLQCLVVFSTLVSGTDWFGEIRVVIEIVEAEGFRPRWGIGLLVDATGVIDFTSASSNVAVVFEVLGQRCDPWCHLTSFGFQVVNLGSVGAKAGHQTRT